MKQSQLNRIEEGQRRIEAKLDALLQALADEGDEEEGQCDLDGNLIDDTERDENEPL